MANTTVPLYGPTGQVISQIAVIPNAGGTSGVAQLVGVTDANGNVITPLQDSTLTSGSAKAQVTALPALPAGGNLIGFVRLGDASANPLGASQSFPLYVDIPNLFNTSDSVQTWPALSELSNAATPAFGGIMNWATLNVSMGRIRALYLLITTAFSNASTLGTVTMQPYVGRTAAASSAAALDSQHLLLAASGLTIGSAATTLPVNNLYRLSAGDLIGTGLTPTGGLPEIANIGDPYVGLQLTFTTPPTAGAATFYIEVTGA